MNCNTTHYRANSSSVPGDPTDRLQASYRPFELKGKWGLLPFCERTLILSSDDLPEAPQPFFEALFGILRKRLLPALPGTDPEVSILTEPPMAGIPADTSYEELRERKIRLTFRADGQTFQHTFFFDFLGGRELPGPKHPIGPDMAKVVNKWLAHTASPYRLYFANFPESQGGPGLNGIHGKETFGLLLMTEAQFGAWHTVGSDYFLSPEVHDTSFTPAGIERTVRLYEELGLFRHLSPEELAEGRRQVQESEITGYAALLACFPKTMVVFDWETGNLENPYEELIGALAAASRGAFAPTKVRDSFLQDWQRKASATRLSFESNGKVYSANLELNNDWLDPKFLELAEGALKDAGTDGRWHYCHDNGQESGYLFLTGAQYRQLKEQQPSLFPDGVQ